MATVDLGLVKGADGAAGANGADGASTYLHKINITKTGGNNFYLSVISQSSTAFTSIYQINSIAYGVTGSRLDSRGNYLPSIFAGSPIASTMVACCSASISSSTTTIEVYTIDSTYTITDTVSSSF